MPDLPSAIGISDTQEATVRNRWDTVQIVLKRLEAKGITVPEDPPPFPLPEVTTTLVDTDNQEYLRTNAKYLAWLNFIMPHISLNEALLLQIKNEKSNIETLYRDAARRTEESAPGPKNATKDEVADNTALDPRYVELSQFEQQLKQEKAFLEDKKEEIERVLRVISRHIEVKKLDAEMNRTGANLPQRRPFNRGARDD